MSIEPNTKRHFQPLIHTDIFQPPLRQSKCTFDVFVKAGFISGSVLMPRTEVFPQVLLQIQLFWGLNGGLGKRKKRNVDNNH